MGSGVDFPGANATLGAPSGEEDKVIPLRVFRNGVCTISCWELSGEELREVLRTGKVWLTIMFGDTMPPAFVGSEETVREVNADYGLWKRE